MPNEPSILDYLKARLSFGRKNVPAIPPLPQGSKKPARIRASKAAPRTAQRSVAQVSLPWRSVSAVVLLLLAQSMWAKSSEVWQTGLLLGILGLGAALWAYRENEWRLPFIEKIQIERKAPAFRLSSLGFGLVFFALTFLFSGGNRFTWLNVLCWLLSIGFVLAAFWQLDARAIWDRERKGWQQGHWGVSISRWTLVLVAAFALIAFFRFSQLSTAPAEMNSDHAEKLLDVNDILQGQTSIFFERNTGREPLQFYLTAFVGQVFGTGLSFQSLKLGTTLLAFISLIYIYLLGKEFGGRWVGLLALLLVGVAFWPNLLARTGLRFSLYPTFAAPALYYLIHGLRRGHINDFLLSGLFMGLGLNGYTAFRIVPVVAGVALLLFLLHTPNADLRRRGLIGFALLALVALVLCTPLLRYAIEHPAQFGERTLTRMFETERSYVEPAIWTFAKNVWAGLGLFNYNGGNIWLVGLTGKPAFDGISAALLILGVVLAIARYVRTRSWLDLFILLSIPLLMLPSTLSLAFPEENPAMNRASGAWIPAFLLCALALDAFAHGLRQKLGGNLGLRVAQFAGALVLLVVAATNAQLFFGDYIDEYDTSSWNSSELGTVIADFARSFGSLDSAWVVAYPHWVDTRLVGMNAGNPARDYGIWPDQLSDTLTTSAPKIFLLKPEDEVGLETLQQLYPNGLVSDHTSRVPGKEFLTFFVPVQ